MTRIFAAAAVAVGTAAILSSDASARGAPESFADLAEQLSPAVVNISTSQTVERPQGEAVPNLPEGSPFEDLFRDFFNNRPGGNGPRTVNSLGSGFVVDPSGYVVTNNHVIEGADEIEVNFIDGTSLAATLVGTDPKTDIAVLKVEPASPLVAVPFGESAKARVGEWVVAIGNPFGLGGSVSAGIISAINRDINSGPYDNFIQTDAAINRGNSGGPLFNMDGEVIGVNTAIISPSGGSIGIGFSVPSDTVKTVVSQLREFGSTRRGWLGVRIQTVTDEIAESLGLDSTAGALVADVTAGGPAEDSGITSGDVILKFDGGDVVEMRDLPRMVADTEVGKSVRVVVWRKGSTKTVKVVLGLLEEAEDAELAAVQGPGPSAEVATEMALGMKLETLDEERRALYQIADEIEGVVIGEVDGVSEAAEKGVRPGDVIVEVAQSKVSAPEEVVAGIEAARAEGRKSVLFLIHSQDELRFVALALEEG